MLDAFIEGLFHVLSWPAFGFLLLGALVGFIVGILPGLGGLATLALMLPFAYKIGEPISAFAFLLGMHAITGTTGDLTSILFGIPGEGTAAATIMDGYPMTKNGEAGRAMGAALMSSLVAGLEGALILALAIPIMRPLVLFFGSPELFMLAILGITFIASLSGSSLTKGLLCGGIGLMLAAIGVDPQTGTLRYTMGTLYLWDGLSLGPVVVGLFAIPEIIDLAVRGTSIAEGQGGEDHRRHGRGEGHLPPLRPDHALRLHRRVHRRLAGPPAAASRSGWPTATRCSRRRTRAGSARATSAASWDPGPPTTRRKGAT